MAVSKGPQSQFRYCWWRRSSHGTDSEISEIADPASRLDYRPARRPIGAGGSPTTSKDLDPRQGEPIQTSRDEKGG